MTSILQYNGVKWEEVIDFEKLRGKDGIANMEEVTAEVAKNVTTGIQKHVEEFDHALLHDSTIVAGLEVDVSTIKEGDIIQRKGNKFIGVKLPKAADINGLRNYVTQQGVSNIRHASVTSSRELEPFMFWIVDASGGDITLTIPSAAGRENSWLEIMRIDDSVNTVTVVPTGSENLSGMSSYILSQWTDFQLFAYNNNYLIRQAS